MVPNFPWSAGWALPRPFLYLLFFHNKNISKVYFTVLNPDDIPLLIKIFF
jgi:hypothetical protein